MSALAPMSSIEVRLEQAYRRYHVRAQAARFASGWLAGFAWGARHGFSDWTMLLPIAGSAAWTTAMEMWPMVPWATIRKGVRAHEAARLNAAASGSPGKPPSGTGQ